MAVSPYGRDFAQRHRRRVMLAIVAIAALLLAGTTFIPFPSTDPSPRANDAVLTSEGGLCAGKSLLLTIQFEGGNRHPDRDGERSLLDSRLRVSRGRWPLRGTLQCVGRPSRAPSPRRPPPGPRRGEPVPSGRHLAEREYRYLRNPRSGRGLLAGRTEPRRTGWRKAPRVIRDGMDAVSGELRQHLVHGHRPGSPRGTARRGSPSGYGRPRDDGWRDALCRRMLVSVRFESNKRGPRLGDGGARRTHLTSPRELSMSSKKGRAQAAGSPDLARPLRPPSRRSRVEPRG